MALSQRTKGILSIIGGNYNIYLISYINHFHAKDSYELYFGYVIKAFISYFFLCFSPVGGIIDRQIGCHWTIVISTLIQLIAIVALFFIKNLAELYSAIILLSIGMGIGIRSPIKNCCLFFPNHMGMICALIYGIGGLSAPLFNIIGETIINSDNKVLLASELYFNYSISKNLFTFFYVMLGGVSIAVILSLLFTFQYEDNENENQIGQESSVEIIIQSQRENTPHMNNLKQIITSYRIWNIFIIIFLGNFLPYLIAITFKVIGTYARLSITM